MIRARKNKYGAFTLVAHLPVLSPTIPLPSEKIHGQLSQTAWLQIKRQLLCAGRKTESRYGCSGQEYYKGDSAHTHPPIHFPLKR